MKSKIYYYSDPLNDDFAGTKINSKPLKSDFKYKHTNIFFRFFSNLIYFGLAKPLTIISLKIISRQKVINKKVLKSIGGAYILYGNHTMVAGDAFVPTAFVLNKRNHVIVNNDAYAIPMLSTLLSMLNTIPLSDSPKQMVDMHKHLKEILKNGDSLTIYPEAHIWPYYTDIRPFKETSFKYAVKFNVPIFTFTNCYQKGKFLSRPKLVTVINGPFYPDKNLNSNEATMKLRNEAYNIMKENAKKYSTYSIHQYYEIKETNSGD